MATEVKETDVPTRSEWLILLRRIQNDAEQSAAHGLDARHDAMTDVEEWIQELLDNHLPVGGNFDDMPF